MAYKFPEGGKFLFSNTFAAAKTLATISNANPAVAGSVAHGYVDADEIVLTSGWEDATDSVFRVDQLTL
ncbi:MAG: phage tail protein, partial [Paucibacter sp.]|nr:phage tail protein [Roseateles sp.]